MSTDVTGVISDLQAKLAPLEAEVLDKKKLINLLCSQYGIPPIYSDANLDLAQTNKPFTSDEFYGRPLAESMRKILEHRKSSGGEGPATPREIYQALIDGGFEFEAKNEQNALTGMRISLRKSSKVFHRLPDGKRYGLLKWYPKAKASPPTVEADDDNAPDSEPEQEQEDVIIMGQDNDQPVEQEEEEDLLS